LLAWPVRFAAPSSIAGLDYFLFPRGLYGVGSTEYGIRKGGFCLYRGIRKDCSPTPPATCTVLRSTTTLTPSALVARPYLQAFLTGPYLYLSLQVLIAVFADSAGYPGFFNRLWQAGTDCGRAWARSPPINFQPFIHTHHSPPLPTITHHYGVYPLQLLPYLYLLSYLYLYLYQNSTPKPTPSTYLRPCSTKKDYPTPSRLSLVYLFSLPLSLSLFYHTLSYFSSTTLPLLLFSTYLSSLSLSLSLFYSSFYPVPLPYYFLLFSSPHPRRSPPAPECSVPCISIPSPPPPRHLVVRARSLISKPSSSNIPQILVPSFSTGGSFPLPVQ
jgi:hypothetical protein